MKQDYNQILTDMPDIVGTSAAQNSKAAWDWAQDHCKGMRINRAWAMPSHDTLSIKPIEQLVKKYIAVSKNTADPFARNCKLAKWTNDLNPETSAEYHLLASDFLNKIMSENNIDLVLFDPPYSSYQVKECYSGAGIGFFQKDAQNAVRWTIERDIISKFQKPGAVVISFGWTTTCMGKKRGYSIKEILMISHGPAHNDTLVTVEVKE